MKNNAKNVYGYIDLISFKIKYSKIIAFRKYFIHSMWVRSVAKQEYVFLKQVEVTRTLHDRLLEWG